MHILRRYGGFIDCSQSEFGFHDQKKKKIHNQPVWDSEITVTHIYYAEKNF